ncbi:Bug family tripartite tricarboxylate transporter substrate binding protein [Pseudorhodoplanes sp.]|uniref:Bug family tripartite tricarboxylate transporter substrate binding protein n=1 Tax=Pseudorhodoplanes sp. TaxID=1934341 RepID=UPI002B542FA0|nr:tripartite tricarboxylate transporter substrate-binding protein [Pseudorhodoplanes sp.]HWV41991.1 tripartite tricarboxylate transporter substrate-binding protein [Pseudorhodoplanes sp.]
MMFRALTMLVLLGAIVGDAQAQAQTWPDRPIRFIVTQAAGGTPDIIARLIGEKFGKALGQQVVVENRPGGGNVIGAQAAARSAPDGYTFLFATAAALVTNPHTFKTLPYDAEKDFAPVGTIARVPFFVMAHPSIEAKNLPELIALEKAKPGSLSVATDGQRNFSGMLTAWLSKLGGVNLTQVPYTAMPQGIQDTVAGRVQVVMLAVPSAAPFMQRGQLRALATSSASKVPGFDQVTPIAETYPGFDFIGWFVLVAPAGTPADIIEKANRTLDEVLKDPEVKERMQKVGFYSDGAGTPQSTAAYIRDQYNAWGKVVKEIGLQKE